MRSAFPLAWLVLVANSAAMAANWQVRGRVLDESGHPVGNAAVAEFWSSNGTGKHPDGKPFDLKKNDDMHAFWGHIGKMEPRGTNPATTSSDGSFSLSISDSSHTIMAMDSARQLGGIAVVKPGNESLPVTIRLGPLVRIRGRFEGPAKGQIPYWSHVYILTEYDPTRPLDSGRLAHCGSFDARFEVALPPGSYRLEAYSQYSGKEIFEGSLIPDKKLVLGSDKKEVDLGVLELSPHPPYRQVLEELSKSEGSWYDHTKHYGEPAPDWHATDARGISKTARIADFKGKWVLLDFWGLSCRPCLSTGIPKLMKFYDDHASQRDQFEIISICIDYDGTLKSMADLDRALAPIIKHVWKGKTLPFPILLDPTFKTWERFGITGLGSMILVDPKGNLVKGDETTLEVKLEEKTREPSSK